MKNTSVASVDMNCDVLNIKGNRMKSNNLSEILSWHIQTSLLKIKIKIMVEQIKEVGLDNQFIEFIESNEVGDVGDVGDVEEVFIKFAQKYPDKFYIVPQEQRSEYSSFFSRASEASGLLGALERDCGTP